jgi:hypothetical protein
MKYEGEDRWFRVEQTYEQQSAFGLTQACRQLRNEFLPIHRAKVKVDIFSQDMERYLEDFFPNRRKANGTLILSISTSQPTLDMLPLMRLATTVPTLETLSFLEYCVCRITNMKLLDGLFGMRKNLHWLSATKGVLTGLKFTVGRSSRLSFEVNPMSRRSWMPYKCSKKSKEEDKEALAWLEEIGLGELGLKPQQLEITAGVTRETGSDDTFDTGCGRVLEGHGAHHVKPERLPGYHWKRMRPRTLISKS